MHGQVIYQPRTEIPAALVSSNGYTEAQAQAIYHHHVAPLDDGKRLEFLSMVYNGKVASDTVEGRLLLVTSQGWM